MTVQFSTSPNVCCCTTWWKNQEILQCYYTQKTRSVHIFIALADSLSNCRFFNCLQKPLAHYTNTSMEARSLSLPIPPLSSPFSLSGGFRPGPVGLCPLLQFCSRPPSFVAIHDFFSKITQIFIFFAFPNYRKAAKFAAFIERPKTISALASGGLRSLDPLTRGPAPGPSWALCLQTPVICSLYRARHRAEARAPRYCGLEPPLFPLFPFSHFSFSFP